MRLPSPLPLLLALLTLALPARAAEPLKVGALLSVTGPASFLGGPEQRTLEMAVEDLNARGGLGGRPVQLIVKDTGGSPEKAVSFAKQLIDEEQVFAIIGPSTSGETMAVKGLAEGSGTLLLSCAAAEVIVNPVARWVFKTAQKDSHAAAMIFQQLRKQGLTKVGVLTSNTGFGKAGKEQLEKLAPEFGVQILVSETYDKAATDLTAEVTKVKAAGVQALVNWSIEPAQAIVIKNARQLGLTIPIFQSHGFGNIQYVKAAGAAAEGVVFPMGRVVVAEALPEKHPQKQVLVAYKKAYEARFKEDVSGFGGYAYDALLLLSQAVKAAGTEREAVRSAVEKLSGVVGVSGTFGFSPTDHNGLGLDSFELLTVKDGKFALLGAK
ncbi:MAG: ABC transporter substrate-binding protein [Anaeromyxobacter sp.]|nr:ABC transporter substrate-binding protein [Anaeromyxobacter sp.]MBL0278276.1 ABC transporter substrate-binding protein [Anaeromyxobacter sp.]